MAIPARFDYRPAFLSRPRLTLLVDPQFYKTNPERNYVLCSIGVEQTLPKDFKATFRYLLIPNYFLRRLALPPNQRKTYADAEYSMNLFEFSLANKACQLAERRAFR